MEGTVNVNRGLREEFVAEKSGSSVGVLWWAPPLTLRLPRGSISQTSWGCPVGDGDERRRRERKRGRGDASCDEVFG